MKKFAKVGYEKLSARQPFFGEISSRIEELMKKLMTKKEMVRLAHHKIATGVVHRVPTDLRKVLIFSPAAQVAWEDITPLARNEWICWIESAKKLETRSHRIERTRTELIEGMRRPCCWAGCIHR